MNPGSTDFAHRMAHASRFALDRCIKRYEGTRGMHRFSCRDQCLVMAVAQLTYRDSVRDIEASLGALPERLSHLGMRGHPARNTLAAANEQRDWRIDADFAQLLIAEARRLYASEPLDVKLQQTVYALDSTTIELCLALCPWAHCRETSGALKLHALLWISGAISPPPSGARRATSTTCAVSMCSCPNPAPSVMDRGSLDCARRFHRQQAKAVFVTRAKKNFVCRRLYSRAVDRTTGLLCDQTVGLTVPASTERDPDQLRRVRFRDLATGTAYPSRPHERLHPPRAHHCPALQVPLASRDLLQVDQAAPADHGVLRPQRERRADAAPDRQLGLRLGCSREAAAETGA